VPIPKKFCFQKNNFRLVLISDATDELDVPLQWEAICLTARWGEAAPDDVGLSVLQHENGDKVLV